MSDLWNKPVNELSAKESVKLQLQITAAVCVIGVAVAGFATAANKASTWNTNRKAKKIETTEEK